jgi:hypothetical protein
MDYHQKALNIQKLGRGVAKAMTAETCVLMGMVKSKMSEYQAALDVRSIFFNLASLSPDSSQNPQKISNHHSRPLYLF